MTGLGKRHRLSLTITALMVDRNNHSENACVALGRGAGPITLQIELAHR